MKPNAAAYRAVLTMLGLEAQTCVFIDDVPANVEAAQAVGIHGIVFEDNPSCLAALTRLLKRCGWTALASRSAFDESVPADQRDERMFVHCQRVTNYADLTQHHHF